MPIHAIRQSLQTRCFASVPGRRDAAVALVLTPDNAVVLMKRAERDGDPWSGHLSFPGGKIEPQDTSPLRAAIRETHEEMGFLLDEADYLGALSPLPTHSAQPQLLIHPYVFALHADPLFSLNEEVVSAHLIPLDDLLAGVGRGDFALRWRGEDVRLPAVKVDGHRLWGLTLLIIDELLDRIDQKGRGLLRPTVS